MKDRIKWIDIAKCLGIFFVFLGHFGKDSGLFHDFVFKFHVPLFFFLAGCTERIVDDKVKNKTIKIKDYTIKNFKRIMIPFFTFSLISLGIYFIIQNNGNDLRDRIIDILNGVIRNEFVATSLWFLSCLFFMKVIFYFLKKIFKKVYFVLPICCVVSFCMYHYIMQGTPSCVYNIDSALYYIIFYSFGYYLFNLANKFLDNKTKLIKVSNILLLLTFYYSFQLFFGNDLLEFMRNVDVIDKVYFIIRPSIMILFILLVSSKLINFNIMMEIGKDTLYLCGSEYIVKRLVVELVGVFGITITFANPLSCVLYVILLIMICYYILIPIEKKLLEKVIK